jgi:hypothetical protein
MHENFLNSEIKNLHDSLSVHPMYKKVRTMDDLKIMMESHVFAVWDFMSLLKRLQKEITCTELPWKPSPYPKNLVRLINEIVLGEESDLDQYGEATDHFSMYLNAMKEVQANTNRIYSFLETEDFTNLLEVEKEFVQFNLNLSKNGKIHEVAAAFFFGREKLIPDMFTTILSDFEANLESGGVETFPHLKYYLKRHIELDGGEHSHHAMDCLVTLCGDSQQKWQEAINCGIESLKLRQKLWSDVEIRISQKN